MIKNNYQQQCYDNYNFYFTKGVHTGIRVHTHKFVLNSRTFHGLLNPLFMVFKDYKFMKNTDLQVTILLQIG